MSKPYLTNISGLNHGPIPDPWPINHENAQFIDVVTKLEGCENWDHAFRESAIGWLTSLDEETQVNVGAHLDKSSVIFTELVKHLEITAEANEQTALEIRELLEDLEAVHEDG